MFKICKLCKAEKNTETDFYKIKNSFSSKCKECISKDNKKQFIEKKEFFIQKNKNQYNKNKKDRIKKQQEYYIENKLKIQSYNKSYFIENKDKVKIKQKEYFKNNKEKLLKKAKKYNEENVLKIRLNKNQYYNNKRNNDPFFKLKCNIRSLIINSLKKNNFKKSDKTSNILGCTFKEFKIHLEKQFDDKMNWNNQGSYWELDHIKPISLAQTEQELIELNHYTNFQPLYWEDNNKKSNKY